MDDGESLGSDRRLMAVHQVADEVVLANDRISRSNFAIHLKNKNLKVDEIAYKVELS